ncbi:tubulin-specific chaperone e [Holotrichia oblita]|uniref:Tubulin-specific chaperone e n=1 Tax=Holotrichia oblita TaxID=644536 RepID=A0ACB9TWA6_HOLOL|nr:tubulin-specific chaperone e [Holotrichia oblita]
MAGKNLDIDITNRDLDNHIVALLKEQTDTLIKQFDERINSFKKDLILANEEIQNLKNENSKLKHTVIGLEKTLKNNNIVIFGIPPKEKESRLDLTKFVLDKFETLLNITCSSTEVADIYRVGKRSQSSAVIIKFCSIFTKDEILRNCSKLKGTGLFVTHDLSYDERQSKKKLRQYYQAALEKSMNAKVIGNKLIIENVEYTIAELEKLSWLAVPESSTQPGTSNQESQDRGTEDCFITDLKSSLEPPKLLSGMDLRPKMKPTLRSTSVNKPLPTKKNGKTCSSTSVSMEFTKDELVQMIYILGECERNPLLVSRIYQIRYPNRRHPEPLDLERLRDRFETTGHVEYKKEERAKPVGNENSQFAVLAMAVEDPHTILLCFKYFQSKTFTFSDFYNLRVVNLRLQNIYACGESDSLENLCPNISELDVSKNLFPTWLVIFDICRQLKSLSWLNVSENNLQLPDDLSAHRFDSVEILICGFLNLTWFEMLKLSHVFPNLEELRLPNNRIEKLDTPVENNFKNLKVLDLENNPIGDWDEILKLRVIPTLEQLSIENIGLKNVKFEENSKTTAFPNLKKLILTNNLLNDWESVGELNKLENLEELKFLHNPILETENFNTRTQLIIAKIANLKYLNGSFIASDERRGAEYDYVKKYGLEYLAVRNTPDELKQFLAKHHRYEELLQECGVPEESELTIQPKVIKVSLIDIDLIYEEKVVRKKLPPSIIIQKLIMLVQRLFNLSERPNLTYISSTEQNIEIILDDECKELGYYSMQNGDKIIIKT